MDNHEKAKSKLEMAFMLIEESFYLESPSISNEIEVEKIVTLLDDYNCLDTIKDRVDWNSSGCSQW